MFTQTRNTPILLFALFFLLLPGCSLFRPIDYTPPGSGGTTGGGTTGGGTASAETRLREDVVRFAGQFIGAPYTYAGKTPDTGFDCSGFTSYVLGRFDISLSPSSRAQEDQGRKVRLEDVRPGDLIFFRRTPLGSVFHVSLVVDNDRDGVTVIHSVSRGVVRENITLSSYWSTKIPSARDVISGRP